VVKIIMKVIEAHKGRMYLMKELFRCES